MDKNIVEISSSLQELPHITLYFYLSLSEYLIQSMSIISNLQVEKKGLLFTLKIYYLF